MCSQADDPAEFKVAFCTRVRSLRMASGMTQAEMAAALGIPLANYEKYEGRSLMPHRLIEPFAAICGIDARSLFERPAAPEGSACSGAPGAQAAAAS